MAKNDGNPQPLDVSEFLASLTPLPPVYDATDFTNRPFILQSIDWQIFEPTERNRYNTTEKLKMTCQEVSTGKIVLLETTQKGIVTPVAALEAQGLFPCRLMIVKEGKYCTVIAR